MCFNVDAPTDVFVEYVEVFEIHLSALSDSESPHIIFNPDFTLVHIMDTTGKLKPLSL